MKLIIGADRAGFILKEEVKAHLISSGHEVEDLGMLDQENFKAYYQVAPIVAKKVQDKEVEKALLFCGTGMGMAIVANKFKGVYASVVEGSYTAKMSKIINNSNILTIGGWVIGPKQAIDMIEQWLGASFAEGSDEARFKFLSGALDAIKQIEDENFK